MADVEQTQKMIPFITCEISLCQYVCELVLGVNVIVLDHGVQRWRFFRVSPYFIILMRVSVKNCDDQTHRSSAGIPSILNPASKEMISDSVELCETEICFLHIQLIATNVWLPKMHNVPNDGNFESSRSPAKSES